VSLGFKGKGTKCKLLTVAVLGAAYNPADHTTAVCRRAHFRPHSHRVGCRARIGSSFS
jgi:hypothetical protein